jgi:UDP-N-acetylmuramyl pentapeptide phosphotransferase/UDP-N-acetylglucosamine-1-phosphate transferase
MLVITATTILVFLISIAGIRLFIMWSLGRHILDIPNERSSHSEPVPVGAGIVIAGSVLAAFAFSQLSGLGSFSLTSSNVVFAAYFCGAVAIVAVSWLDDLKRVHVIIRLVVHGFAAVLLLAAVTSWRSALPAPVPLGLLGTFLWIVGLTNAYNFMDGIDGIAGIQGVVAGIGWAAAGIYFGNDGAVLMGSAIAAACAGYLVFNWEPAKVFMGDAGSAFLGFTLATIPVIVADSVLDGSGSVLWSPDLVLGSVSVFAVAFVWPFVFDSSYTFLRRLAKGEKVWKPHRSHIYQRMVQNGFTHASVSTVYGVLAAFCGLSVIVSGGGVLALFASVGFSGCLLLYFSRNPARSPAGTS